MSNHKGDPLFAKGTQRYADWVRSITTTRRTGGVTQVIGGDHTRTFRHRRRRSGPTTRNIR